MTFFKFKPGIVFSTLLVSLLWGCSAKNEIKPTIQDIKELVFASGQLEWDDAYYLTAQTDGVLYNVNFEVGNKVEAGHTLASIDNKTNALNAEIANQQLAIANINVTDNSPAIQQVLQNIAFAESKYEQDKQMAERYERLYKSESASKVQMENMMLNAKNSLANLNALKKQHAVLMQQARQAQIASKGILNNNAVLKTYNQVIVPQKGVVIKKNKNNGDYIRKGEVIAVIANPTRIEAVLNVDEESIAKIKLGQTVFIQLNTQKNKVYNGKIVEIQTAFDAQSQSFICKVEFDAQPDLNLFGTQLEANVLVGEKKKALLIPRTYLAYGNKVHLKSTDAEIPVKTGIVSTEYVEILDGISANDVLLPIKP